MKSPLPLDTKVEHSTNLRIITFSGNKERMNMENMLAQELERQTEELGECHLLLDFTKVEFITSAELGTLISLNKRIKSSGGRLTLFNLNPLIFEVFLVTRLETLLEICREKPEPEPKPERRVSAGPPRRKKQF